MAGFGTAPAWLNRAALAAEGGKRNRILVTIFQRGAADGLNMVVPFGEKNYYQSRPSIAVPPPGKPDGALDLDGRFALHPAMPGFARMYKAGHLAIVEACGSHDATRSHFDAQDYMESGTPGVKSTRDGWLNRGLEGKPASPVRAVAVGSRLPRALRGASSAVAVANIAGFKVQEKESAGMFEQMYTRSGDTQLMGAGRDTFEAVKLLESIGKGGYTPGNGAQYPPGRFAQSMQQIARLIKADAGVEVAFADIGGWDHHTNEAAQLPNLLREFSGAITAFCDDLGDRMADVVLVTMSEFGRTAHENGNRGTDHGHANVMFVVGGGVRGGRILGPWPGLDRDQLYEGRDLAVTTDFRQVLSEVAQRQMGRFDPAKVFPGFRSATPIGIAAG